MNKQQELDKIAKEIELCNICKIDTIGKPVPGEGNPDADIVFMGEAPGKQEAKTGRPFIGRSGQLLRKNIRAIGLEETDVFITSPVKYLPQRGTPTPTEVAHSLTHTLKQLQVIQPKIIILLGATAALAMFGEKLPILKRHGELIKKGNWTYYLTLHPAAAIRFQKFMSLFEKDFQELKKILEQMNLI